MKSMRGKRSSWLSAVEEEGEKRKRSQPRMEGTSTNRGRKKKERSTGLAKTREMPGVGRIPF